MVSEQFFCWELMELVRKRMSALFVKSVLCAYFKKIERMGFMVWKACKVEVIFIFEVSNFH